MNRKHTVEDYCKLIEKLKKVNPLLKFSSDFIIGYPGETENDFNGTINLLKKINFIHTYSFIYSSRPGTPAAKKEKESEIVLKEDLLNSKKLQRKLK